MATNEVALLLLCGVNPQTTILLALPGVVAIWRLTKRYFFTSYAAPRERGVKRRSQPTR